MTDKKKAIMKVDLTTGVLTLIHPYGLQTVVHGFDAQRLPFDVRAASVSVGRDGDGNVMLRFEEA